jgi:hypothetical protein
LDATLHTQSESLKAKDERALPYGQTPCRDVYRTLHFLYHRKLAAALLEQLLKPCLDATKERLHVAQPAEQIGDTIDLDVAVVFTPASPDCIQRVASL